MTWAQFCVQYATIIGNACKMLKPDRFATYVVTELRDEKGLYRRFPDVTVDAFEAAGLRYYNEAILVTSVGSLPVRVGNQFRASRKLGRTHQNILTFIKGDPKAAAKACTEAEEEIARTPGSQKAVTGSLFDDQEATEPAEEPAEAQAPVEHSAGSGATPGEQADLFGGGQVADGAIQELQSPEELEETSGPGADQAGAPAGVVGLEPKPPTESTTEPRVLVGAGEAEGDSGTPEAKPAPASIPEAAEEWF